jgi:hypothetical protein
LAHIDVNAILFLAAAAVKGRPLFDITVPARNAIAEAFKVFPFQLVER